MEDERLFFSVMPGNEDEINELYNDHWQPISFPDFSLLDFSFRDFPNDS